MPRRCRNRGGPSARGRNTPIAEAGRRSGIDGGDLRSARTNAWRRCGWGARPLAHASGRGPRDVLRGPGLEAVLELGFCLPHPPSPSLPPWKGGRELRRTRTTAHRQNAILTAVPPGRGSRRGFDRSPRQARLHLARPGVPRPALHRARPHALRETGRFSAFACPNNARQGRWRSRRAHPTTASAMSAGCRARPSRRKPSRFARGCALSSGWTSDPHGAALGIEGEVRLSALRHPAHAISKIKIEVQVGPGPGANRGSKLVNPAVQYPPGWGAKTGRFIDLMRQSACTPRQC